MVVKCTLWWPLYAQLCYSFYLSSIWCFPSCDHVSVSMIFSFVDPLLWSTVWSLFSYHCYKLNYNCEEWVTRSPENTLFCCAPFIFCVELRMCNAAADISPLPACMWRRWSAFTVTSEVLSVTVQFWSVMRLMHCNVQFHIILCHLNLHKPA